MPLPTVSIFGTINNIELKYSQAGMAICSFTIECSEKNAKSEWENLQLRSSVFEKSAEFVNQWFQNGALCIATGKLITEVYEKDGKKTYTTKLKSPRIEFPPKAKNTDNGENNSGGYANGSDEANRGVNAPTHYEKKPMPQNNNLPEIDIYEQNIPF